MIHFHFSSHLLRWGVSLLALGGASLVVAPMLARNDTATADGWQSQATSAAIEMGKNAIEQRLNRVPQGAEIEVAFAPNPTDQALRLVEKVIDSSNKTIIVAAYQFTSKPVSDALIRAHMRGVKVLVVLDAQSNRHGDTKSKVDDLQAAGIATRLDDHYPIMHDKFIVVDDEHVETGSYNFTYAAQRRNAENLVVIWHNAQLASLYTQRFNLLWQESSP